MNKKSFFWMSYADLMSSLFFIMLVLFVLVVVLFQREIKKDPGTDVLKRRIVYLEQQVDSLTRLVNSLDSMRLATQAQLDKIKEIQNAISNIDSSYFDYNQQHKKHVLRIDVEFPTGSADMTEIPAITRDRLCDAGDVIQRFIESAWRQDPTTQYLLIIEGQASRDNFAGNNELSYQRALALRNYWKQNGIEIESDHCEVIVAGSGQEGTLRMQPDNATNKKNQRFLIHILPKPGIIK